MESYLKKKQYVFRKSYKRYFKYHVSLQLASVIFSTLGLSAFSGIVPLAVLSLGTPLVISISEILKIKERLIEYKKCYKFYSNMLLLFRANRISENDVYNHEREFVKSINVIPVEKYLKEQQMNGYNNNHNLM